MYNCQCDRCGKVYQGVKGQCASLPTGWFPIDFGKYPNLVHYQICPECKEALGIPATLPDKDVGEKLLEILAEFVVAEAPKGP